MTRRKTREKNYVRLSESRIREIKDLVASWPFETKSFMRARLNQYKPPSDFINILLEGFISFFVEAPERNFEILKDPNILTDWQKRFEISGQTEPQEAWNKILEKEVAAKEYYYLLSLLEKELLDVHVPDELEDLFVKLYRAHLRKEYMADHTVPKAPLLIVVGPSGSGKTVTVTQAIEQVIFANEVLPEIDLQQKKEEALAGEPFWKSIDLIDPHLAEEIARLKKLKYYKRLSQIPFIKWIFKRRIGRQLSELEEQGIWVDYRMVTPNDYQTALAGEPGNYFRKAMGDPKRTAIRHVEEAHSAFGKSDGDQTGSGRQQRTLVDTSSIVLDEVISGRRDCLLIATTDQPERFDPALYRRFVEKGRIIDISNYWKSPANLKEVVRLELLRNNIRVGTLNDPTCPPGMECLSGEDIDHAVVRIFAIFEERSLKLTPAYVRKLISSLIDINSNFSPLALDDPILVRQAFELVAQNMYGDLYHKVVDRMNRKVKWEEYIGEIKDLFSEMANNCLFYEVSEEKGVVLNGPPGSGKTFLARTWLSENIDVHDVSVSPTNLQDPVNPIDGAVENLEKVYDVAKMIAPSIIFFDEGDALAPKRSATGGAPADKLTNKFLNLIDGEIPLRRVFTVLTTNRLDILDPALIRSQRLKVMEVSGHLRKEDITAIIQLALKDIPLGDGLDIHTIFESAKSICNTPADFSAFVDKACSLRSTEYQVLERFRTLAQAPVEERQNFIKFNFKTLMGISDSIDAPQALRSRIKNSPAAFHASSDELMELLAPLQSSKKYPLVPSHLHHARKEISQSPTKKGKVQLDEFLEAELSQEPQVGFIIGVGANDVSGVLLPIATSLTYHLSAEKVLVTGAVSTTSPGAAQMDMAVQMTQQSAQEALTMVKNYFQDLLPAVSIARLFGEFFGKYTIHHQLLSASYNVGGPSAGYALALNTLSALLHVPIYNDFGITGAPWTKGVKKGEVGGSVIIGGHKRKTEKVLLHLRRMYMPLQNYHDLDQELLSAYWSQGKDVLGVTHFGDLVPEVVFLDPLYEEQLLKLIELRIDYKQSKYQGKSLDPGIKGQILSIKQDMKSQLEREILSKLGAIRDYLRDPYRDPHLSMREIFRRRPDHEIVLGKSPLDNGTTSPTTPKKWSPLMESMSRKLFKRNK